MKRTNHKKNFIFTLALFITILLGITSSTNSHASGGVGTESDTDPCPNGCSGPSNPGSGGSRPANDPYWVYFRIKDNAKGSWKIAGQDVSGCKKTEGVYFSFQSNNKDNAEVKNPQETMPWSGWDWSKEKFKGHINEVPFLWTTHQRTHKVADTAYDSNVFEPEYIITKGQKAPNGKVHDPISESDNYTIGDLNKNGKLNETFIWYDKPTDATLYIAKKWDKYVRLFYFDGNDYYYNPKDKNPEHPYGKYCWLSKSKKYSANACKIYAYDPYTFYGSEKLGNYYAGDNGKKRVVCDGGGTCGKTDIEWASRVNVVWFCSGTANGVFTGASDGKVSSGATESTGKIQQDTANRKITRYFDGTNSDGKYTIKFTHTITRTDKDTNKRIKPAQEATIVTTIDGKQVSTEEWTGIRLNSKASESKNSSVKDVKVELGKSKTICQTLSYQRKYKEGLPEGGKETSVACVVISQPVILTPGSSSYVDNSVSNNIKDPALTGGKKTLESWASSKKDKFTYSFTHRLKAEGPTGYASEIEYYVTQTKDNIKQVVNEGGSESSPNKKKINSGTNNYQTVFTSTGSWDSIGEGGKTPTICQTIYFRPKKISVNSNSGVATVASGDKTWQSSTVCTLVNRRKSTTITLSAASNVTADGRKNPSSTVISTRNVDVVFDFTINTKPKDRKVNTNYAIERLVYSPSESKDWSKAEVVVDKTPASLPLKSKITNSFTIKRTDDLLGKTIIVCERIKIDPDSYRVDYKDDGSEDGITAHTSSGYYGEKCAAVAWPQVVMMDDGEITIYAKSSATINDAPNAGYDSAAGVYVMKGEETTIVYTHELRREKEYHAGGNKTIVGTGENVDIRYRLDDPSVTFTSSSIADDGDYGILPSVNLATNSHTTVKSDTKENFKNKNTKATAARVGTEYIYCQAIDYLSSKYTLRGAYYQLDGKVYSGDPNMIYAGKPVSKNVVGKSSPGCVKVIRPYNFKITDIPVENSPETVIAGSDVSVSFSIDVAKNDGAGDYMITDIPEAAIQVIKLTVTEPLTKNDSTAGGTTTGNPCSHFTNTLGNKASCEITNSDTKTIAPGKVNDGKNANYYPNSKEYSSRYTIQQAIDYAPTTYKICYAIAIKPRSSGGKGYATSTGDFDTNSWVVSDAACINVGKRPTMQVWGGSVFSSGGIRTAHTRAKINGESQLRTFGSWSDYMIIANGTNKNMASGATLISGMTNTATCKYSPLTIANSKCNADTKELGSANIDSANSLERGIYEYYIRNNSDKYLDLKTVALEGSSRVITRSTLNEASGTYPIVIYNNDSQHQNLYIKEDINVGFSGRSYNDVNIPQVIIYTPGDVYISPSVTRIDAWIIAGGEVRTCASANGTVIRTQEGRVTECSEQLTITGPIYTKKILFDRIANGDIYIDESGKNSVAEPAELIDLSPAVYLFGYNESTNNAQPIVTYMHKLPVRY